MRKRRGKKGKQQLRSVSFVAATYLRSSRARVGKSRRSRSRVPAARPCPSRRSCPIPLRSSGRRSRSRRARVSSMPWRRLRPAGGWGRGPPRRPPWWGGTRTASKRRKWQGVFVSARVKSEESKRGGSVGCARETRSKQGEEDDKRGVVSAAEDAERA